MDLILLQRLFVVLFEWLLLNDVKYKWRTIQTGLWDSFNGDHDRSIEV